MMLYCDLWSQHSNGGKGRGVPIMKFLHYDSLVKKFRISAQNLVTYESVTQVYVGMSFEIVERSV